MKKNKINIFALFLVFASGLLTTSCNETKVNTPASTNPVNNTVVQGKVSPVVFDNTKLNGLKINNIEFE